MCAFFIFVCFCVWFLCLFLCCVVFGFGVWCVNVCLCCVCGVCVCGMCVFCVWFLCFCVCVCFWFVFINFISQIIQLQKAMLHACYCFFKLLNFFYVYATYFISEAQFSS